MLVVAMALLAPEYPAFDAAVTAKVCETKRTEDSYATIYPSTELCVADQQADHRRFVVVARDAGAAMRPSFERCVETWSKEGLPDWGMIEFCAVGNIDGKRDFALLRKAAASNLRPALDKCIASESEEPADGGPAAPDWEDVATCARSQLSGARDFALFVAAEADASKRKQIEACRTLAIDEDDHVIDWDDAVRCAAKGGAPVASPEEGADEEIVVT